MTRAPVLCDPELPPDWREREARRALQVQEARARQDETAIEPSILDMFRRAARS